MCDYTNREEAMVTIARDDQGIPTIWSDPCIAPIVKALNAGGLPTVASCCGHGNIPGIITLGDGRHLVIFPAPYITDESTVTRTPDADMDFTVHRCP
jgi:hypothetical protein